MSFEEQILAYLDDSLPMEERDAVLHEAHSSRDARALLEAHVRLSSLYALTARPVSAPLDIQRELAAKVPILAVKLPYLATPQKRRKGILAWFWESKLNVILLLLAALLGAGIWYAVSTNERLNIAQTYEDSIGSASATNTSPRTGGNSLHNGLSAVATPPTAFSERRPVDRSAEGAYEHASISAMKHNRISNAAGSSRAISTIDRSGQENGSAGFVKTTVPRSSQKLVSQKAPQSWSLVIARPIARLESPVSTPNADTTTLKTIPMKKNTNSPFWHFFGAEEVRFVPFTPQTRPTNFARQQGGLWASPALFTAFEIGSDDFIQIQPWLAFGFRASYAPFIQEQQVIHDELLDSHINKTVSETILIASSSLWYGPSLTFSINPDERLNLGLTAVAGYASLGKTLRVEATANYSLWYALGFRASLFIEHDWASPAQPIDSSSRNPSVPSGVSISSLRGQHQSQLVGISFGIFY